jgi:hypothetical protein
MSDQGHLEIKRQRIAELEAANAALRAEIGSLRRLSSLGFDVTEVGHLKAAIRDRDTLLKNENELYRQATERAEATEGRRNAWKQLARTLIRARAKGTPDYQTACRLGVELLEELDEVREECLALTTHVRTLEADLAEARARVP